MTNGPLILSQQVALSQLALLSQDFPGKPQQNSECKGKGKGKVKFTL
jgi:hypothetical protein